MTTKSQKIEGRILSIPRVVLAGTHSGVGKTSLTLAIVAALRRRGYRVQTFKVGPDFLDPSYLALASGRPCYNLDGWMSSREYVEGLFARAAQGADISVIEGVMGMYDGAGPASSEGSTAEIARWLKAPVLLVVDASGMAFSLAAMVKGYAEFEPDLRICGVIANRCGTAWHVAALAEALQASSLPPLVGGIPLGALPNLPSRHLGLVTADSRTLSAEIIEKLALAWETHATVEEVVKLSQSAPPLSASPGEKVKTSRRVRIGIPYDAAFHFYYPDLLDELEAAGGEVHRFSPIQDSHLPRGLQGLYLGGGYPEEHAEALAANENMLSDIRQLAVSGRPIYAECGGLMYLGQKLETLDGREHSLVGVLPATTRMLPLRKALGYVEIELREDSLWGSRGATLRGHEFHYSELVSEPAGKEGWRAVYNLRRRDTQKTRWEGFQRGRVLASYAHLHLASRPEAVKRFLSLCEEKR